MNQRKSERLDKEIEQYWIKNKDQDTGKKIDENDNNYSQNTFGSRTRKLYEKNARIKHLCFCELK